MSDGETHGDNRSRRSDQVMAHPLFNLWVYALFGCSLAGPVILIYQSLAWLKSAEWPTFSLGTVASWMGIAPHVEWRGLEIVLQTVLSAPLWLVLPLFGLVALNFTFGGVGRLDKRKRPS